jgi:hypothetical protein
LEEGAERIADNLVGSLRKKITSRDRKPYFDDALALA